jgi:hypothetical protein
MTIYWAKNIKRNTQDLLVVSEEIGLEVSSENRVQGKITK